MSDDQLDDGLAEAIGRMSAEQKKDFAKAVVQKFCFSPESDNSGREAPVAALSARVIGGVQRISMSRAIRSIHGLGGVIAMMGEHQFATNGRVFCARREMSNCLPSDKAYSVDGTKLYNGKPMPARDHIDVTLTDADMDMNTWPISKLSKRLVDRSTSGLCPDVDDEMTFRLRVSDLKAAADALGTDDIVIGFEVGKAMALVGTPEGCDRRGVAVVALIEVRDEDVARLEDECSSAMNALVAVENAKNTPQQESGG